MTSRFDSFEKDLRDALASEDLPSAGFTDRVMASVAEIPQQKKTPPAYRRWLVSAAACLAVAAVLFPLLRNGRPDRGSGSAAVLYAADNDSPMDEAPVGQGAPTSGGADAKQGSDSQQKLQTPDSTDGSVCGDRELAAVNGTTAMDDALSRAADALAGQGCTLTVTAREGAAVQVLLTDAAGGIGDPAELDAAMTAEGFTAADNNWYTYEEDTNS